MAKHLQSAASGGHLLYGGNGHLANECPDLGCSGFCDQVQPNATVTDSGGCSVAGTYVFDHYEVLGGGCRWWWFLDEDISGYIQDYWLRAERGDAWPNAEWIIEIVRELDYKVMFDGDGLVTSIECDGNGILDHTGTPPITLVVGEAGLGCAPGDEAYVTFNP